MYLPQALETTEFVRRQANTAKQMAANGLHAPRIENQKSTETKKKGISTDNELPLGGTNSLLYTTVSTSTATPTVTMTAEKTFVHTSSVAENIDSSNCFGDIKSPLPTSPLGKSDDDASNGEESNSDREYSSSCDSEEDEEFMVRGNDWCQRNICICG